MPPADLRVSDDAVRLASRLFASLTPDQRVILFTGTTVEDNASIVSVQVALAFSKLVQERILLLDARIEVANLHETFRLQATPGLSEVLARQVSLEAAISRRGGDNLSILPRGGDADFTRLFGSEACKQLLQSARAAFRVIVVDGSSILHFAPMSILASQSDGVVAVAAAGRSQRADIVELKRILDGIKVPLVGAVLTTKEGAVWSGRGGDE